MCRIFQKCAADPHHDSAIYRRNGLNNFWTCGHDRRHSGRALLFPAILLCDRRKFRTVFIVQSDGKKGDFSRRGTKERDRRQNSLLCGSKGIADNRDVRSQAFGALQQQGRVKQFRYGLTTAETSPEISRMKASGTFQDDQIGVTPLSYITAPPLAAQGAKPDGDLAMTRRLLQLPLDTARHCAKLRLQC